MNSKWTYIPVSVLVLISIVSISLEVPQFGMMVGFWPLLILAGFATTILTIIIYKTYCKGLDQDNLFVLSGSSILFGLVVSFASITFLNRVYATNDCERSSYKVVAYSGRYSSGYGKLKKEDLKANQWLLGLEMNGETKIFNLSKNIFPNNTVTSPVELEFCKGILGTRYLKLD